jgi:hypothetical protein
MALFMSIVSLKSIFRGGLSGLALSFRPSRLIQLMRFDTYQNSIRPSFKPDMLRRYGAILYPNLTRQSRGTPPHTRCAGTHLNTPLKQRSRRAI